MTNEALVAQLQAMQSTLDTFKAIIVSMERQMEALIARANEDEGPIMVETMGQSDEPEIQHSGSLREIALGDHTP